MLRFILHNMGEIWSLLKQVMEEGIITTVVELAAERGKNILSYYHSGFSICASGFLNRVINPATLPQIRPNPHSGPLMQGNMKLSGHLLTYMTISFCILLKALLI